MGASAPGAWAAAGGYGLRPGRARRARALGVLGAGAPWGRFSASKQLKHAVILIGGSVRILFWIPERPKAGRRHEGATSYCPLTPSRIYFLMCSKMLKKSQFHMVRCGSFGRFLRSPESALYFCFSSNCNLLCLIPLMQNEFSKYLTVSSTQVSRLAGTCSSSEMAGGGQISAFKIW